MPDYRCNDVKPQFGPSRFVTRCDRDSGHPGPHRNGSVCWEKAELLDSPQREADVKIRQWAVEQVLRWVETFEDTEDDDGEEWAVVTPELIVAHARIFEAYVQGEL